MEILEDGFFDDYEEETLEDVEEEVKEDVEEKHEEPQENQEETQNEPFLTIKYNKEDKNLSHEEAVTYAQKGMNYDRIYQEYQTLNNQIQGLREMNNQIQNLANLSGMSVEDYLTNLSAMQDNFAISEEFNRLREEYPEADEQLLAKLAESNVQSKRAINNQEIYNQNQKVEQENTEMITRQVQMLENRYPDANINELVQNDAFMNYISEGYSVLESYQLLKEDERAIIEKEAQKTTRNIENKSRSLGDTTNTSDEEVDDFLSGFNSI